VHVDLYIVNQMILLTNMIGQRFKSLNLDLQHALQTGRVSYC